MDSTKLFEQIKANRINSLEDALKDELNEMHNKERELGFQLDSLDYDIQEWENKYQEFKQNIKFIVTTYGNEKKINDDLIMLDALKKLFKEENEECNVEYFLEESRNLLQETMENKAKIKTKKDEIETEVRKELKKIKRRIGVSSGGKTDKKFLEQILGQGYEFLNITPESREILEQYSKYQNEILEIENDRKTYNKIIEWMGKSREWLPDIFGKDVVSKAIQDREEALANIEKNENYIKLVREKIKEKRKSKKLINEKLNSEKIANSKRKTAIESEQSKLKSTRNLAELGLNIKEAKEELNDQTEDYLVMPIKGELDNIFSHTQKVYIEIEENKIENEYNSNTLNATVNSNFNILDENIAILIPISMINRESIVKINEDNEIVLREFELPKGTKIITDDTHILSDKFDTIYYDSEKTTLKNATQEFLGENFTENEEEYKYYQELSNIENKDIIEDDIKKTVATIEAMHKNYFNISARQVKVDGEYINIRHKLEAILKNEEYKEILENELSKRGFSTEEEEIISNINYFLKDDREIRDSKKTDEITQKVEEFIENPHNNIDVIYRDILNEYLTMNTRAMAFYNEEKYSNVNINNKSISIKPKLPQDKDKLPTVLFRKSEDKVYKVMKTAALCNKMAHLYEYQIKNIIYNETDIEIGSQEYNDILYGKKESKNEKINILVHNKKTMFLNKSNLMKQVIEMSKGNESISLGTVSDERGEGMAMDVPGYSTLVLHVPPKETDMFKNLEKYKYVGGVINTYSKDDARNGVISSGIISYGINKKLIEELKSIKRRERLGFLNNLGLRELQNILVRLGYTSKDFGTPEGKKRVLEELASEEKIDEILKDDELCR